MTPPAATRSSIGARGSIYTIKITLNGVKPSIWRRLRVPGAATLGWLHAAIQVAMGWTNSHLHQFTARDATYSEPRFELDAYQDDRRVLDENEATLAEVVPRENDALGYEYDFGDAWEHRIVVETILPSDDATRRTAECVGGTRACPPEDCGGTWGYDELLEVLGDPQHEEHESMKEWLGRPFDPEAFDCDKVNECLGMLTWPHTTEEQLARVLMRRDGVGE